MKAQQMRNKKANLTKRRKKTFEKKIYKQPNAPKFLSAKKTTKTSTPVAVQPTIVDHNESRSQLMVEKD